MPGTCDPAYRIPGRDVFRAPTGALGPSAPVVIRAALTQIPGVSYVDLDSVPDHVLVDVTRGDVMPEELTVAAAGTMTSGTQCLVDIMKSCISASLPSPQH